MMATFHANIKTKVGAWITDYLYKDRGSITVQPTSSLTGLEMQSKLDKPILNIRAKYISKLVKQVSKPVKEEVSRTVTLPISIEKVSGSLNELVSK